MPYEHTGEQAMGTQHERLRSWIGPVAEEMSSQELDAFSGMMERIMQLYRGTDEAFVGELEATASGALQVLLEDVSLEMLGEEVERARVAQLRAIATAKGAVIAAAAAGVPESEIAAQLGLPRATVCATLNNR